MNTFRALVFMGSRSAPKWAPRGNDPTSALNQMNAHHCN